MNIMRQIAANYGKRLEQSFKMKASTMAKVKFSEDGFWYQDPVTDVWYRSDNLFVELVTGRAVIIK